jgi:signal transduction histidine kinase
VLARGERAVVELEGRDATAAPLAIEFTISPMDGAGTLLVEGHDVTARRSREQRRRDVLGDAAHELRAPLVGVRGALAMPEASHDARVDARARDLLRLARANADRLMRCVTDLLDLDRIRSGVVPVASQSTAAVAIARSAVEALGPLARARGVRLTTRDIRSGAVLADHDRAAQVLATLLSCAVDAAAEGSTLRVTASRVGAGRVRVALDDPEGAISAEGRRAIAGQVERVECADAVPATAPGGESGLGVAIARALIERQGGSLGASADADRAGVCWVELPAAVDVELATVLLD